MEKIAHVGEQAHAPAPVPGINKNVWSAEFMGAFRFGQMAKVMI
jgi:hypothetical protein